MDAFESARPETRVPVGEVALAAYRSVFGRLGLILELGWLPLLVLLATTLAPDLIVRFVLPAEIAARAQNQLDTIGLGQLAVNLLCLSAFAVRWHQIMLSVDPRALSRRLFLSAWLRFIAYTFAVYLIVVGYWVGISFARQAIISGGAGAEAFAALAGMLGIGVSLFLMRGSLLFPAAATGRPLHWLSAWRLARGNTWRLIGTIFLVLMPIILLVGLVLKHLLAAVDLDGSNGVFAQLPLGLLLLDGVLEVVLDFIFVALVASILSDFYRRIVLRRAHGGLLG